MSKSPDEFDIFAEEVRARAGANSTRHWFRSSLPKEKLWQAYLSGFEDPEIRQQHNCQRCKSFITRYGGLVFTDGRQLFPVMWPESTATTLYAKPLKNILSLFSPYNYHIAWPFHTKHTVLGTQEDPEGWTHFWTASSVFARSDEPKKKSATLAEDKRILEGTLIWATHRKTELNVALELLKTGDSFESRDKHVAMLQWLMETHEARDRAGRRGTPAEHRRNHIWHTVSNAPVGFCHIQNSVVGMLVDDLHSGHSLESARRRFNAAMNPLQYQRPQAAPSEGNIRAAEALFQKLGLAKSLERRMATLADIQEFVWKPAIREPKEAGIFAHLSKESKKMELPSDSYINNVSWVVFERDVLPQAKSIRVKLGYMMPLFGLTAGVHPDAPPLFQWDSPEHRNDVAWYTYVSGSSPSQWGLVPGEWVDVVGVIRRPDLWNGRKGEKDATRLFLVNAKDSHNRSLAIFPECLRSELREVRATIEAHSGSRKLQEVENPACAIGVPNSIKVVIEVAGDVLRRYYRIDRWE